MATLILGRDGMGGEATEADFDAWVAYVCEHIDETCGFEVDVDTRGTRDVQDDAIVGCDDDDVQAVHAAVQDRWDRWCSDGAPGIQRSPKTADEIVRAALDAAGQAGGRDEIEAIAANGPGDMTFSDDEMAVLLEAHGTPGNALYAIQLEAQRRVSANS